LLGTDNSEGKHCQDDLKYDNLTIKSPPKIGETAIDSSAISGVTTKHI
jgi:hypothetical protein